MHMKKLNTFLHDVTGVIHIGANTGQERKIYDRRNLDVVWVEPIPNIFSDLLENIQPYPNQKAYQRLITDKDGEEYTFHIASNNGASSSIFELGEHFNDIYPTLHYTDTFTTKSITLPTLIEQENISLERYNSLVMDTQGAELLVLKGAEELISKFKYIRAEAANFELYDGCCMDTELEEFLKRHNFKEAFRKVFSTKHGDAYDIIYENMENI